MKQLNIYFLAHLYKSTETYCCHFVLRLGAGVSVIIFYVMGKALSGELACMGTGPVSI